MREVLLQGKKKLKNSLMEAVINLNKDVLSIEFTKKMAKGEIKRMGLEGKLLGKLVRDMDLKDLEKLGKGIKYFS